VRRCFHGGPFTEGVMGLRLRDDGAGCAIEIFAHFQPRNALGTFLVLTCIGMR
jgi:hypothetical protein